VAQDGQERALQREVVDKMPCNNSKLPARCSPSAQKLTKGVVEPPAPLGLVRQNAAFAVEHTAHHLIFRRGRHDHVDRKPERLQLMPQCDRDRRSSWGSAANDVGVVDVRCCDAATPLKPGWRSPVTKSGIRQAA